MTQWYRGYVQWFDKSSGEGIVVGEDGESYYVHYSTIESKVSRTPTLARKQARRDLDTGDKVKFLIYENLYSKRIDKVRRA